MALGYMNYVEHDLIDDKEDIFNIMDYAADDINKKFDIKIKKPEQLIAIFAVTFRQAISKLKEKSMNGYPQFKIIIANRVEIGFDNATNPEYEKNGGFMAYVKHLYNERKDNDISRDYEDESINLCATWNSVNITTDSGIIKEIATDAYKELNSLDLKLGSSEVIMPLFISVYDAMISYLKIRRAELKEFEIMINFVSLFDVTVHESDDMEDVVLFTPSIEMKTGLKSDLSASSQFE